jgi:hypothetical protein
MKPTGRLHIYPPSGPHKLGYVVADRQALKGLAEAAKTVAAGNFGFETIKLYSADGHEYELVLTSAIGEEEWQTLESHYAQDSVPTVGTIQDYHSLKQELSSNDR